MPGQGWLKGHHRYVAALLLVGAAFAVRWALAPVFAGSFIFSTFYPVIVITAYFAGARPAALAAVLSGALHFYEYPEEWVNTQGNTIGEVKNFICHRLPRTDETIHTSLNTLASMAGVTLVEAQTTCNGEPIAGAQLKIFIQQ